MLANALLANSADVDQKALANTVRGELPGEDLVGPAAFACRQAGGAAWQTFRVEARRLLGNQPLAGDVVVLVNRLD